MTLWEVAFLTSYLMMSWKRYPGPCLCVVPFLRDGDLHPYLVLPLTEQVGFIISIGTECR